MRENAGKVDNFRKYLCQRLSGLFESNPVVRFRTIVAGICFSFGD